MAKLEDIKDKSRTPKSVAVIMDGNGRWAKKRGLDRSEGHREGVEALHDVLEAAKWSGVKYLIAYTFSTENWNRPKKEVDLLMNLVSAAIVKETPGMIKEGVRFHVIGDMARLPQFAQDQLNWSIDQTKEGRDIDFAIAMSYSSRSEITDTVQRIAKQCVEGTLKPEEITEQVISQNLFTSEWPDPDLLIRTGGELRISNYLLWQISYSELYFTDIYWPDFRHEQFYDAVLEYQNRERRYGKTSAQVQAEQTK